MLRKLTRFALSFSLLATLLVGVSVATIAPAQAVATCAAGGPCALGDTGPGGGKVFYVSATTFTCGPSMNLRCKYLEAAPKGWNGNSSDGSTEWAPAGHTGNYTGQSSSEHNGFDALGRGYIDSIGIVNGEGVTVAAGIARGYLGGGKNDWYLGSQTELNLLCQFARGVTQNVTMRCTGGTTSVDFSTVYWSTGAADGDKAWDQNFTTGVQSAYWKYGGRGVRPIRAFNDGVCAAGGACVLGDTGPGGGKVFYVSTSTFTCGPTLNLTCKYLEFAPYGWNGGADPALNWTTAGHATEDFSNITNEETTNISTAGIGLGHQYSDYIVAATGVGTDYAAGLIRSKTIGGNTDWYLPTSSELNQLCKYARGLPWTSDATACSTSGSLNTSITSDGFRADAYYLSSSERSSEDAKYHNFTTALKNGGVTKYAPQVDSRIAVRPIRAFGISPAKVDQATLTVNSASGTFGMPVMLGSTGGSGSGTVTFATTSTSCSISGSTLSVTAAVTCAVVATKTSDASYNATTSASENIVFAKALPSVSLQYPNSNTVAYSLGGTFSPTSFSSSSSGAITFSTTSTACSIDSSTAVISILAAGVCDAYISVAEFGNYTARSSYTRVTISGLTGLTPTFDTATATSGGFTVNIINYSVDYVFVITVDTGTVTVGVASGSNLPITVSGLAPGVTATITVVVTRNGYTTVSSSNAGSAISNKTVTFKSNYSGGAADTTQLSNIATNLTASALTRASFTFNGWNTAADGTGTPYANASSYAFGSDLPLFAQWIQNSLVGVSSSDLTLVGSITAASINSTFTGSTAGSTVSVQYLSGALPTGTVINIHLLGNTTRAASLITSTSTFILSFIVSWLAPDATVPLITDSSKAISMTISNALIKKGASVYSVIGNTALQVGTATSDGSVTISITEDPEIVIAIKKPDAPTNISATNGANAVSTITWDAPANNGGAEITSYLVTSSGGQTCAPDSLATLSCVVTGLTNGGDYTFTVTATNNIGTGAASTSSMTVRPLAPVVGPTPAPAPTPAPTPTPAPPSGGSGIGYTAPVPTPIIDLAALAAVAAKAEAEAKAAKEKAIAEAKALEESKAAEEAALLAVIKVLQDKAEAEAFAAAKKFQDELAAAQLKAEEELKAAAALKFAEEQRIAAERSAAAKKITTVYSTSAVFKLNQTYTKRLNTYTKKIATGSTVTCIGYAKSSKTLSYAKAKVVATKQAKALCSSMKKINPTLKTKSIVYPASKAPKTTVNKKWIPVSYRIESPVN